MSVRDATELHLTERQREVLELLARGRTNPQIAEALGISLPGAKWHVSEVMNKLGVTSREQAVEAWQGRNRQAGRLRRVVHGFIPVGALKWTLTGGGVAVAGVSVGVGIAVLRPGGPNNEPRVRAEVQSQSNMSLAQAEAHAKDLIVEALAPYTPHVATPEEEADYKALPADATGKSDGMRLPLGRPVIANDYVVLDAQFRRAVTTVETNVAAHPRTFPAPRNVWVVRLAMHPPWREELPVEAELLVAFDDDNGELVVGGLLGSLPVRTTAPETASYPEATALADFDTGTVMFWLFAFPPRFGLPPAPGIPARAHDSAEVCLSATDSRMPGGYGGGCIVPKVDRASNAMQSQVKRSGGYAQAVGLVADNVVQVRATTDDGRVVVVEPGPPPPNGFAWRGFIAVAPGPEEFVLVEALDTHGTVLDSSEQVSFPTSPPPPGDPLAPTREN